MTGPFVVLLLTGCLAVLALTALLTGRLPALIQLGTRASARMTKKIVGAVPVLWGLAAGLLLLLVVAVSFKSHTLAFLGWIGLVLGLALAGLGLAVAALSVGARLSEEFPGLETERLDSRLDSLRLGLWLFVLAAAVPFAGWFLVLGLVASGVGTVLETLVTRRT